MTRVLVVDDDPAIVRTLSINLRARDYEVETAADGREALELITERLPDVVVLDLGLPDLDGISVLRQVRSFSTVPVVVLSARHESDDKVEALDLGANDYVTKPFGMEELLARVRAALRHGSNELRAPTRVIETGTLRLDIGEQQASKDGEPVHLTPTEWRLVDVLTQRPARWCARSTSSARSGVRRTTRRATTCGCSSPSSGASWSPNPVDHGTSSPNQAWAIGSSPDHRGAGEPGVDARVIANAPNAGRWVGVVPPDPRGDGGAIVVVAAGALVVDPPGPGQAQLLSPTVEVVVQALPRA